MLNATPALKLYASFRLQQLFWQDAVKAQERQLKKLILRAKDTSFGRQHAFSCAMNVEDYQKSVPLRKYEQFWSEYLEPNFPVVKDIIWPGTIPYFAVSSGTTSGSTKYIPYTDEMTASNTKASMDLLVHHLNNKPDSQILGGKSFMLGGSTKLSQQADGIFSGDLSGIAVKTMRSWVKPWYFPPEELALIENWEEKITTLARHSLKTDIRMLGGVPTWLLIFFDELKKCKASDGQKIRDFFPNLELLVHGGVPFAPYIQRFSEIFANTNIDFREVYPASEAFIALADRAPNQGLRLLCDHGNFFEFVPVDELESSNITGKEPSRYWLGNVETGVNYAVVLSTCAGLWSYIIGDTVEFVQLNPPRILITGRTAFYLSAFGEHVIADEIEKAIAYASEKLSISIEEYTVGALFPKNEGELGQHLFILETKQNKLPSSTLENLSQALDSKLSELNEDYKAHRAEGFGLNAPKVQIVEAGTFLEWMKSRGKLGGQNKIPRIISKNEIFDDLIKFINK